MDKRKKIDSLNPGAGYLTLDGSVRIRLDDQIGVDEYDLLFFLQSAERLHAEGSHDRSLLSQ